MGESARFSLEKMTIKNQNSDRESAYLWLYNSTKMENLRIDRLAQSMQVVVEAT